MNRILLILIVLMVISSATFAKSIYENLSVSKGPYSIKILDHTDQCLVNCETTFQITTAVDFDPKDFSIVYKDKFDSSQNAPYQAVKVGKQVEVDKYCLEVYSELGIFLDNESIDFAKEKTREVVCGKENITVYDEPLKTLPAGSNFTVKLIVHKQPQQNIDFQPKLKTFVFNEAAWYNTSWGKCQNITTLQTFKAGSSLRVGLTNSNFNYSRSLPNLTDIIFLEGDCNNPNLTVGELPRWNETVNTSGNSFLWFKTNNSNKNFSMYSNSTVSQQFTVDGTFLFGDDFELGTNLNLTKWDISSNNNTNFDKGYVNITSASTAEGWFGSSKITALNQTQNRNITFRYRFTNFTGTAGGDQWHGLSVMTSGATCGWANSATLAKSRANLASCGNNNGYYRHNGVGATPCITLSIPEIYTLGVENTTTFDQIFNNITNSTGGVSYNNTRLTAGNGNLDSLCFRSRTSASTAQMDYVISYLTNDPVPIFTLSGEEESCACYDSASCTSSINSPACTNNVVLTTNVTHSGAFFTNTENFTRKTFNCQNNKVGGGTLFLNMSNNRWNVTISNCILENYSTDAITIYQNNENITLQNNKFNNITGKAILFVSEGGATSRYNVLRNNTFNKVGGGIFAYSDNPPSFTRFFHIENNTFENSTYGLWFEWSNFMNITSNNFMNNTVGIYLREVPYNLTIRANNITNSSTAIHLQTSNITNIWNNTITRNNFGINFTANSTPNNVTGNIIENNTVYAISIQRSEGINISHNRIRNASTLLVLGNTTNNKIFNNLLNVTNESNDFSNINDSAFSMWNVTLTNATNIVGVNNSSGNYYAKLGTGFSETCTDADFNGICDTSYTLATNNVDFQPLAAPQSDTTAPNITFVPPTPANDSFLSQTFIPVNISANDTIGLSIINISLFNSSGALNNSTTCASSPCFVNFTGLSNGIYYINATANDTSNNINSTGWYNITLDTTFPTIQFVAPTEDDAQTVNQTFVAVNVTATDNELDVINISLFNASLSLNNSTTCSSSPCFINFTGLAEGTYYYNATVNDTTGNVNTTELRSIFLSTTGACTCSSQTECNTNINSPVCQYITLTSNININTTFINNPANFSGKTFDCDFNIITTNGNASGFLIQQKQNIRLYSCNLTNVTNGAEIYNSSYIFINRFRVQNATSISISIENKTNNTVVANSTIVNGGTIRVSNGQNASIIDNIVNSTIAFANNAQNSTISRNVVTGANGITLSSNMYINVTHNILENNTGDAIFFTAVSSNNTIFNNTITAADDGIRLIGDSANNTIANNTVTAGTQDAFELQNSYDNVITNNTFENTDNLIDMATSSNNLIYNNILNATSLQTIFDIDTTFNNWNTSLTSATSIIGGANIGGNYYEQEGSGFSETCSDIDSNNICDSTYTIETNNQDFLALTLVSDSTSPNITFVDPTPNNNTNLSQSFIPVNVTANDSINLSTINISIYNSSNVQINTTTCAISPCFVNFTGLSDGIYYINGTANDTSNNLNQTETRTITLDTVLPIINFTFPTPANDTNQTESSIYVNVTASDALLDLNGVEIFLYNSTVLLTSTFCGSPASPCQNNFTDLIGGVYYINATTKDTANNSNFTETRIIRINDTTAPNITFASPTPSNNSNLAQNFIDINATAIDEINLTFILIDLYNSSNNLINNSSCSSSPCFVNFTNLSDGIYYFNATALDNSSNSKSTGLFNVTLDATGPTPVFVPPTPNSSTILNNKTYIEINVTSSDPTLDIINITLFNSTSLVNNTSCSSSPCFVNFTGLSNANLTYYFNASANDTSNNINYSETRNVTLTDIVNDSQVPNITFVAPTPDNLSVLNQSFIPVNVTANDSYLTNISLILYNASLSVLNTTTCLTNGSETGSCFANYTGLPSAVYYISSNAYDIFGNTNTTGARAITLNDASAPTIQFVPPTLEPLNNSNQSEQCILPIFTINPNITYNYANFSGTYIEVNVSASDDVQIKNITVYLHNSNLSEPFQQINSSTCTSDPCFVNFTGLNYSLYFINATVYDFSNNLNFTGIRGISLSKVSFVSPTPVNDQIHKAAQSSPFRNTPYAAFQRNFIPLNLTGDSDLNITNLTIYVSNATRKFYDNTYDEIFNHTCLSVPCFTNLTNLIDGAYYINGSVLLTNGTRYNTDTRLIFLDNNAPVVNFVFPPTPANGSIVTESPSINIKLAVNETVWSGANIHALALSNNSTLVNDCNYANQSYGYVECTGNFTALTNNIYLLFGQASDYVESGPDVCRITQTGNITFFVDLEEPNVYFVPPTPANNSNISTSIEINVTAEEDVTNISHVRIFVYNSTGSLVNNSSCISDISQNVSCFANLTVPSDGQYFYNATTNDSTNKNSSSATQNVLLDTTPPSMAFVAPTPANNTYFNETLYMNFNITATDLLTGVKNITINLWNNETGLYNSSTCTSSPCYYNFTTVVNGNYLVNASSEDNAGNVNHTATLTFKVNRTLDILLLPVNDFCYYLDAPNITVNFTAEFTVPSQSANLSVNGVFNPMQIQTPLNDSANLSYVFNQSGTYSVFVRSLSIFNVTNVSLTQTLRIFNLSEGDQCNRNLTNLTYIWLTNGSNSSQYNVSVYTTEGFFIFTQAMPNNGKIVTELLQKQTPYRVRVFQGSTELYNKIHVNTGLIGISLDNYAYLPGMVKEGLEFGQNLSLLILSVVAICFAMFGVIGLAFGGIITGAALMIFSAVGIEVTVLHYVIVVVATLFGMILSFGSKRGNSV